MNDYTSQDVHPLRKLAALGMGSLTTVGIGLFGALCVALFVIPFSEKYAVAAAYGAYWAAVLWLCPLTGSQASAEVYGYWMRRIAKLDWPQP